MKRVINSGPHVNKELQPDLDDARRFLTALTGEDNPVITFQTFDDNENRKDKGLSRILHGMLSQYAAELTRLNQQGAGVFVMVNEGDGRGRSEKNVIRIRAAFVDLDGSSVDPVLQCPLKPHVVTQTSPGKYHAYWLLRDFPVDKEQYGQLQTALAEKFGGDLKVTKDLNRVMRLPGFWHCKGEPVLSSIMKGLADD